MKTCGLMHCRHLPKLFAKKITNVKGTVFADFLVSIGFSLLASGKSIWQPITWPLFVLFVHCTCSLLCNELIKL